MIDTKEKSLERLHDMNDTYVRSKLIKIDNFVYSYSFKTGIIEIFNI